ncbi:VOC family protein [Luteococcus sp. H138]|uniref:VOC family protein n=1 Tax=unclassified Luteococcus TaxID=2639923 RepID=UPI00313CFF56
MTNDHVLPADGSHTSNGRPRGFSSLTPFVALQEPQGAIDFYTSVFGARLIASSSMDGQIIHAEMEFPSGRLQLGSAMESYRLRAVDPDDEDSQFSIGLYVPNVDEVVEAALAAGATLREPVATFVSGDRFGSIRDPFGVRWSVMTRVEDLSDDESTRRVEQWLKEMAEEAP